MTAMLALLDAALPAVESLVDAELGDALIELEQAFRVLDARRAKVLARFDAAGACQADGFATAASWLRAHCGMSRPTAAGQVRLARGLRELQVTAAALTEGRISGQHAQAIVGLTRDIPLEYVQATESEFVVVAENSDPIALRSYLASIRHAYSPEAVVADEITQRSQRGFTMARSLGGMIYFNGAAHPEGGAIIEAALSAVAQRSGPEDDRSAGQRHYDALETLCRAYLDAGTLPPRNGSKPHLSVIVDLPTLLGQPGSRMADLGYAGRISGAAARRIACDGAVSRILTDGPSAILDAGRTTRTVTTAQRRALVIRDGGCVFPRCDAPPQHCDAHHLVFWAHGGPTDLDSLGLICGYHHGVVHEGGWTLIRHPDGSWTATPP